MATWGVPETVSRQVLIFTEIKPVVPGRWKFALEATLLAAVSLTVISVVLSPSLAIIGLIGAFLATIAGSRPWRARLLILSTMYVGYLASVTLGALAGSRAWLLTIVLVLISLVVVLAYNALVGEQPGPMFLIIGAAIASYLPTVHIPVLTVVEINALGTGSACVVSLLIQIARGDTAVHDAIGDAETAVHAYTGTVPDQGDPAERGQLRDRAYAAVFYASTVLEGAVGSTPHSRRWARDTLRLRQLHSELVGRISLAGLHNAPIAADRMEEQRYLGSPPFGYLLRWGLSQRSLPWLAARRLAAAVLLTCAVVYGLHLGHPYWAVLTTALIITVGADRLSLTHRALHRLAGTLAGVLLFFALHALHASGLVLIGMALALVFLMQMVVVRNYALGSIFITPLALLISTANNPYQPVGHIAGLRIVDTAVGAASSLIVIWVSSRGTPVILVRRQYRRALRALERVLVMLADDEQATPAGLAARRDLTFEQLQCAQVLQIAQVDLPLTLGSWGALEAALNKLSYTVLAACWTVDPPSSLHADAMAARLQRILSKLPPVSRTLVDAHELAEDLHDVLRIGMAREERAAADTVPG